MVHFVEKYAWFSGERTSRSTLEFVKQYESHRVLAPALGRGWGQLNKVDTHYTVRFCCRINMFHGAGSCAHFAIH